MVLVKNSSVLTLSLCRVAWSVSRGARENSWLHASEADALDQCPSFIILRKKISIIELNCSISLAYIAHLKVNMSCYFHSRV